MTDQLFIVIVILLIIAVIGIFHLSKQKQVKAVKDFVFKHMEEILPGTSTLGTHPLGGTTEEVNMSMERYRGAWNSSPSGFVEKHQLMGIINAGQEAVLVDNVMAAAFEVFVNFTTGDTFEVWLRTWGDNSTFADTQHVAGTSKNEQQVLPVEDFAFGWVSHID